MATPVKPQAIQHITRVVVLGLGVSMLSGLVCGRDKVKSSILFAADDVYPVT